MLASLPLSSRYGVLQDLAARRGPRLHGALQPALHEKFSWHPLGLLGMYWASLNVGDPNLADWATRVTQYTLTYWCMPHRPTCIPASCPLRVVDPQADFPTLGPRCAAPTSAAWFLPLHPKFAVNAGVYTMPPSPL